MKIAIFMPFKKKALVKAHMTHKLPSGLHSVSGANDGLTTMLYATHTPDVETWHHRLGHCNFGVIVDMARKGAVKGMAINLSSLPPKCDACIRGKQMQSPVSKVREGEKASRPLERVFVSKTSVAPSILSLLLAGCIR